ncbi:MAG: hypothetical protein ACKVS8_09450 [Phycisphaerales bacterium]
MKYGLAAFEKKEVGFMFALMMLSAMLAMTGQPATHPSKPAGSSGAAHSQTASASPASAPAQPTPSTTDAAQPAKTGQPEIDHSPAARRNWDHRRAYYWQEYKRPHRRAGQRNAVTSGAPVTQGASPPPVSVQAVHNLDATVTITWVMRNGVIQEGDVFEVGRRQPGQQDFWKIGETIAPRFVDRQLQTLTSGTQYAVAVRRVVRGKSVWSPMSAVASTRPNHPLSPRRAQAEKPKNEPAEPSAPAPEANPETETGQQPPPRTGTKPVPSSPPAPR